MHKRRGRPVRSPSSGRQQAWRRTGRPAQGCELGATARDTRPLAATGKPVCESHDSTGEPGAGNRPAGFGERGEETCLRDSDCGPARKRRMSHRTLPVTRLPSTLPARAGNTHPGGLLGHPRPVHPRSRGEHRRRPISAGRRSRFIPARAGNTAPISPRTCARPVHPRSRGEHPPPGHREGLVRRFIPARAGNTSRPGSRRPRWCGSSPLARGTRSTERRHRKAHRFIPARAGNTSTALAPLPRWSVHPRSRGEHHPTSRACM